MAITQSPVTPPETSLPTKSRRRGRVILISAICAVALAVAGAAVAAVSGGSGRAPGHPELFRAFPFTASVTGPGAQSGREVRQGETLTLRVSAVVPSQGNISKLWLGISTGTIGAAQNSPIGMQQLLAYRHDLGPGRYTLVLSWHVAASYRPSERLWLVADWDGTEPGAYVAPPLPRPIAMHAGQYVRAFKVAPA